MLKSKQLTKSCADKEPGDTLGVIILLALEDLTSHSFLMQLRRQEQEGGVSEGKDHHGGGQANLRS